MEQKQTVEEAAAEFAGSQYSKNHFPKHYDSRYNGFKAGAEWAASLPTNSMPGWISVKDKDNLPPFGKDFLCLWDNGDVTKFRQAHPFAKLTHWMPLPSAPTEPKQ